jgi:hypothetical protein
VSAAREDLLHLSPEALSHAANAGIVKRAMRELAGGYRPRLSVDAQGALEASFDDGVVCHWALGATIQNARCSCGASGVCRHRVIAALAYREEAEAGVQQPAEAAAVSSASDEVLARVVPAVLLSQAEALRDAGMSVELRRRASGEPCETARLPAATVRYWGGAAIEAARCDCLRASACEHVALGVWAFRAGEQQDAAAAQLTVRLGAQGQRHAVDRAPFEQLVEALLRHGVVQGNAASMQSLSSARIAAADAAWLGLLIADLETWSDAYARRSALYEAAQGVDLLAELSLRLAGGGLPGNASAVLGAGQAGETALDRLRLMCLGARTRRDGEARRTTLVMADVDTGTRLVLAHDWQVPEARAADEPAIRAAERLAPGVRLEALAQGQLLAQQAARRADGSVRLARARSSQNSVLPQSADWAQLNSPVRFDSVAALRAEQRAHPVAALQPRHAARRFVVFSPAEVEEPSYDAHAQSVVAVLRDEQGEPLLVRRSHERHAAQALDALAAAATGRHGPLRHVAGVLSWDHGLPVLEPWALGCEGLVIVPDFAAAAGALAALPLGQTQSESADGCALQLEALRQHLGSLLHHGLSRLPRGWISESAALARRLDDAGLRTLSEKLHALIPDLTDAQANPKDAALAPRLMALLALRQLHEDAAMHDLGDSGPAPALSRD